MFDQLAEAIDEVDIPLDGIALAAVLRLRDRLDARIAQALGVFDRSQLWDVDGASSLTAWLRHQGGLASRGGGRLARLARVMQHLPVTADAWRSGALSGGQVEVIAAHLGDHTVALFAEHEAELVPTLAHLSVTDTATVLARWRAQAEASLDRSEPEQPHRTLHVSETLGGRWALDGDLDPMSGALVATALRQAEFPDGPSEPARTPAARRADALVDVCRFFLDHQHDRPAGRHRPHLNVVVNLDDLQSPPGHGTTVEGTPVAASSLAQLLCDSALHRVVLAGRSTILDYGTATRTIPAPLWNALIVRDRHCRFPGCDRQPAWCEGHHVVPVTDQGGTALDDLVLLCSRHHHRLHHPGWHAKLRPDATFTVTDPTGRVHTTDPPCAVPHLWWEGQP